MNFEVTLKQNDFVTYSFDNGKFETYDAMEDAPISIKGEITVSGKSIGSIKGYPLYCNNFYTSCDMISGDCESIAATLCDKKGAVRRKYLIDGDTSYDRIFILDQIEIDENFRNQGIGSTIIKNLPKMLQYQFDFGSIIFLCAGDFESAKKYGFNSDEYKKGSKRLIEFYERCGYKVVKDNIMVCYTLD